MILCIRNISDLCGRTPKERLQLHYNLIYSLQTTYYTTYTTTGDFADDKALLALHSNCGKITKTPYYVSNDTLHEDLNIPTVKYVAEIFYKRLHSNLHNHSNTPISELSVPTIPGDPRKRLKRTWCRDLLND